MKTYKSLVLLLVLSALLVQACGPNTQAAIATGIAQTQQISALETAAAGGGAEDEAPAEAGPSDTPAPAIAFVSVSQNTNCRSGPRLDYALLTTINPGQQVEVSKTFSTEYVLVKNPNGEGDCWLFLQYADTTDFSAFNLPTATQPPTPQVPLNISAKVSAPDPPSGYWGSGCPIQVQFDGTITVNRPVTVSYYWERSNGSHSGIQSLTFSAAGARFVHDQVELGHPGEAIHWWERLVITDPVDVTSNQATFEFNCPGGS